MRFCSLIQQAFVSSEPSIKGALRYAEKTRENPQNIDSIDRVIKE
jgi:hypothetical protein